MRTIFIIIFVFLQSCKTIEESPVALELKGDLCLKSHAIVDLNDGKTNGRISGNFKICENEISFHGYDVIGRNLLNLEITQKKYLIQDNLHEKNYEGSDISEFIKSKTGVELKLSQLTKLLAGGNFIPKDPCLKSSFTEESKLVKAWQVQHCRDDANVKLENISFEKLELEKYTPKLQSWKFQKNNWKSVVQIKHRDFRYD